MFNRRKKYNGAVAELLPLFGFSLDEAGIFKTLDSLDIAWGKKWNQWEAALYVAYAVYGGMLKAAEPRAQVVIRQISAQSKKWVQQGIVQPELVDTFAATAAQWPARFRKQHDDATDSTIARATLPPSGGSSPGAANSSVPPRSDDTRQQSPDWIHLFGSAPDVMSRQPEKVMHAPGYILVHVKDVPPISQRFTSVPGFPLRYIHALLVADEKTTRPVLFVTLEQGMASEPFLCIFHHDGSRSNLGVGTDYVSDRAFVQKALALANEKLNDVLLDVARRHREEHTANEPSKVPLTPDEWKRVTQMIPDFLRASFRVLGKTPEQILADDWSVGYSWGYVAGYIKTLPAQTLEAAAPELFRAAFEALLGPVGPTAYSRCSEGLSQDGALAAGAKAGETDWGSTVAAIAVYHQRKTEAGESRRRIEQPTGNTTHELFRHFGAPPQ